MIQLFIRQRENVSNFDGVFNMYTGASDLYKIGQISEWNYGTNVSDHIYQGECSDIRGSAGEFFPPHRDRTHVDLFAPDICRTLRFNYEEDIKVHGITGYKFVLDQEIVDNSTDENGYACCNPYPDEDVYLPRGLLNVSACKYDSPAYVSYPHFYLADESLLDAFHEDSAIKPSKEKHETFISLEPTAGIPLQIQVRLQINTLSRPLTRFYDLGSNETFIVS